MDTSKLDWWIFPQWSKEYGKGVDEYIERALTTEGKGNQIRCPCKACHLRNWLCRYIVKDHMISKGLGRLPEEHIEGLSDARDAMNDGVPADNGENNFADRMDDLLHDTFRNGLNEDTKTFYKLVKEGQEELYPGCKDFSRLSFLIRLFVYKRDHKLSNSAFTDLLKLLKAMKPDAKLPSSFHEANSVLKALGLDYIKIDACRNDCILYWEENVDAVSCPKCMASRWKVDDKDEETGKARRIPAKVLRYFPIKKRLQRLFMCPETARYMVWHSNGRPNDGLLRHPADAEDWKNFDSSYPLFAEDPRNVRLGLASDGFNPFNTMSIVHSTWPVMLTNYNLPPWMSMKPEFLMLALLIPGPFSPGNNIDVYLQPLVKDLKELWECGIEAYDASRDQMFNMHAALLFTISDFPAYAMLSGWSTKGKLACPCCHYDTRSKQLKYSRKTCYIDHRRWLKKNHPYRRNKRHFNGKSESAEAPVRLSGTEILELLSDFKNDFGRAAQKEKKKKNCKKKRDTAMNNKGKKKTKKVMLEKEEEEEEKGERCPWKKKSNFFDLPYWVRIACRHCLDVMHIEKNICDSVIGTLLNISGKSKDHLRARMDLVHMDIMRELQPILSEDGECIEMAKSRFWMTPEEKSRFCSVVKNAKLPQVCDSNIARCVQMKEKKIVGYKSHDAHFFMQYLLPIAAKACLHKDIAKPLIRLSAFFKAICNKVIDPLDLDYLQSEISEVLCQFEMIFPPAFFDIMVHLSIHLVEEIRLGGPVCVRWMYPIERYLGRLKSFVRNKSRPEGSMAEAYLVDESVNFCSRYLDCELPSTADDIATSLQHSIFPKVGRPIKGKGNTKKKEQKRCKIDMIKWDQAHRYVLFNCQEEGVERYISEHEALVLRKNKRKWATAQTHGNDFCDWFRERVQLELSEGLHVSNFIKQLSDGPSFFVKRYSGYFINGYKFHTMKRDRNCVTENSGVTLTASTRSFASTKDKHPVTGDVNYYGSVQEIIEIFYEDNFSVVLFGCVWFQSEEDGDGIVKVNNKKMISKHEPFILASQADQIFYVEDPLSPDFQYVVTELPRDHSNDKDEGVNGFSDMYWRDSQYSRKRFSSDDCDAGLSHTREDIPATVVDMSGNVLDD